MKIALAMAFIGRTEAIINLTVFNIVQVELEKQKLLKTQDGNISEFDERFWSSMVDFVTAGRNKEMNVIFWDGMEIMV